MLKVDFHLHTADDPVDRIPHTALDLIDRASALGFDALAITLHDRQCDLRHLVEYACDRGLVLIPGVERTLAGKHVLLVNFPVAAASVESFEDLARLKRAHPQGLVIAAHPFYPHPSCLRRLMDVHGDLFDAVEVNAFYTRAFDFNRAAVRWARSRGRPVVGNSDAHRLSIFGATYSLVDADRDATGICDAVRRGQVSVRTRPLSPLEAGTYFAQMSMGGGRRGVRATVVAEASQG